MNGIFPVDCQAIQLIDRPIKLNDRQQISQIDRQNQDNQIHTDFNTQFQLKVGQSAIVKSRNFELIFLGVTEDSRCPADLNCFESGQIKIALKIAIDGRNLGCLNLANNASIKKLSIKQFNNFLIEFVTVRPYPNSNQIIKTPDYIITLIVKKQT